jgi:hypothetical protein
MRLRLLPLTLLLFSLAIFTPVSVFSVHGYGEILPQTGVTPISPVIVSTQNPNGAIYHIVQYGQTLEMIAVAYGISITELRNLNGLAEGASDIYIGQSLTIRIAQPPTETPTPTQTTSPPTRTPRSITPIMTPTTMPTATALPRLLIPRGLAIQRKSVGLILLCIGIAGLLALGIHYWLTRNKPQL